MDEIHKKQRLMSMTGFGAILGSVDNLGWNGDIRSVNGRSLDIRLRLPDVDGLEAVSYTHLTLPTIYSV